MGGDRGGARLGRVRGVVPAVVLALAMAIAGTGCGGGHHAGSTRSTTKTRRTASSAANTTSPSEAPDNGATTTGADSVPVHPDARVTIGRNAALMAIPHSFLGIATPYWALPPDEHHLSLYGRVLAILHVPGDGRFVMRIGGDSADYAVWDPGAHRLDPWAFPVKPALVARLARIVRTLRLRVIIDLNTVTSTPHLAAAWARAAEARLPRGSILGFEVGNEPDLYRWKGWVAKLKGKGFDLARLPKRLTPADYVVQYQHFAHAVRGAVPGVPLLAPALGDPVTGLNWVSTLLAAPHPGLHVVTVHRYPFSACAHPGDRTWPTVAKLLDKSATIGTGAALKPAVALARRAGLPERLTEINSVTCGGVPGVSNTFATALWAPDALFSVVRSGVRAVNLEARVYSINAPFGWRHDSMHAHPLLYGLIMFKRMLGPDSRLVALHLHAATSRSRRLTAWAVRSGRDALKVLLTNDGAEPARVAVRLPATGSGSVQRLLARSASATSGVTLDGQQLDGEVHWQGRPTAEKITPSAGTYPVTVPPLSAAMLTVHVSGGTLSSR
jgi:Glycosyl hydrolase family 79 C-terminal beta domain